MDSAQNAALTQYSRDARKRAYSTIQSLLLRDVPIAFMWWPRYVFALNPAVEGFSPNPVTETWNAWRWSLQP
jgi:ABC-type transport system substrate-binding protein